MGCFADTLMIIPINDCSYNSTANQTAIAVPASTIALQLHNPKITVSTEAIGALNWKNDRSGRGRHGTGHLSN